VLVRPIKTEADYMAALAEVEQMMGSVAPGTLEGDRFDLLAAMWPRDSSPMASACPLAPTSVNVTCGAWSK